MLHESATMVPQSLNSVMSGVQWWEEVRPTGVLLRLLLSEQDHQGIAV